MIECIILGCVRSKYYDKDKNIFDEVRKIVKNRAKFVYFSETEPHTLVFFISGKDTKFKTIKEYFEEITMNINELKLKYKPFEFTIDIGIFGRINYG